MEVSIPSESTSRLLMMSSATKAKAKVEAAKDKALYHQEGRSAAGLTDEQRRDAASAVKLLPHS
jgi:hypothetical protein